MAALVGVAAPSTTHAAEGDITLFAGNYVTGYSGDGVLATTTRLDKPSGVAVAADGRVFIADRTNNRIRVVGTDGIMNTLVSGLLSPVDVAVDDAAGLLYFSEAADPFVARLSQVDISGGGPAVPTIIAGGAPGYAGDGGPASAAQFNSIAGIDIGPDGDIYIADRGNNRIRRIDVATGDISLVAGTGVAGGDNGDALTVATFAGPKDVAVASDGTVYVADELTNLVRKISGGQVTVFAGNYTASFSGDGGPATSAGLNSPDGVAVGADGDVYIADTQNNRVRKVDVLTNVITTIAGDGGCCKTGDGGPATAAQIGTPTRVDVDLIGNIWIAAEIEDAVRVVEGSLVADAGGPYTIAEGDDLVLDASATVAGAGATYAWDLDGDTVFDDATGATPTIALADLIGLGLADGPAGPVTIKVQVTDGPAVATGESTVTVTNVAPTATISDVPGSITAGVAITIKVGAIDPGPVDAADQFTYAIDWEGDGVVDDTIVGPADPPATHTYGAAGAANLTVTATDKDGGTSEPTVAELIVGPAPTTTTTAPPTTSTTTTPTTTPATTAPPTTVTTTLAPILPPTGGTSGNLALVALLLVGAGSALLVTRSARRPG